MIWVKESVITRMYAGWEIMAEVRFMRDEILILCMGGENPHVGAMCTCCKGEKAGELCLPGHKEDKICYSWARDLSEQGQTKVTVMAGIHYDNASQAEIQEILQVTEAIKRDITRLLEHNLRDNINMERGIMNG